MFENDLIQNEKRKSIQEAMTKIMEGVDLPYDENIYLSHKHPHYLSNLKTWAEALFPLFYQLQHYNFKMFLNDLRAGITVSFVLLP